MNREIELVLPYPPSANRYFRVFKGRAVESAVAKEYKKVVADLVGLRVAAPWTGPIVLHLDVFRPIKSGDLSNRVKVLEDALRGIVYVDDKQVVEIHPRLWDSKEYPAVQVRVAECFDARVPPERWAKPPGWHFAVGKMDEVREKELARDKARAAKREAKKAPEPARPSLLRDMATSATYRKGST